jgi:hypothetical protein
MMPVKPNFTDVQLTGNVVRVSGVSDEEDPADILDIRITLVQGDRIASDLTRVASESVTNLGTNWNAVFPVHDPNGQAADFRRGPVSAFGVEIRMTNATTTTWAQALTIK